MRNTRPGDCHRCGGLVRPGAGQYSREFGGKGSVLHDRCADLQITDPKCYTDTNLHMKPRIAEAILQEFPGASIQLPRDEGAQIDLEKRAFLNASDAAGGYIDRIGKSDLAELSRDEWFEFLQAAINGYNDIKIIFSDEEIPF